MWVGGGRRVQGWLSLREAGTGTGLATLHFSRLSAWEKIRQQRTGWSPHLIASRNPTPVFNSLKPTEATSTGWRGHSPGDLQRITEIYLGLPSEATTARLGRGWHWVGAA
jgi:hypothetical protein